MKNVGSSKAVSKSECCGSGDPAARMAVAITVTVLSGLIVGDSSQVLAEHLGPWRLILAGVGFAAIMVLQLAHSFPWLLRPLSRHRWLTLGCQALLSLVPFVWFGEAWVDMAAFLAGSVLLMLPAAVAWPLFGALLVGTDGLLVALGLDHGPDLVLVLVSLSVGGLAVFGLSRMTSLIAEVRSARGEVARLAVLGERLRFARDLHDLLGLSLSAITLKCELVHRMLVHQMVSSQSEAARQELTEVLRTSRQALADVRAVARGYREVSLTAEVDSAESMLAAVGIRTSVRLECGPLSAEVDTVLATVLREGLTNMLRHSRAEHCAIEVLRQGGRVLFRLANDGAGRPPGPAEEAGGGGIGDLATRVGKIGGVLTAGVHDDGWFRLEAAVTLAEQPDGVPGPREGAPARDSRRAGGRGPVPGGSLRSDLAPRTAAVITLAVLASYLAVDGDYIVLCGLSGVELGGGLAILAAMTLLQLGRVFPEWLPSRYRYRTVPAVAYTSFGLQVVLCYAPFAMFGSEWLGLTGFAVGSVLLLFPPRLAWPLFGVAVGGNATVLLALGDSFSTVRLLTISAVMCALVVFGLWRMKDLVGELHRSRAEQAQLMVTSERLRFARDLHDLMGLSLSTITLKCELAYRLVPSDPERARAEITEILGTSRQALADVRAVARGYREMCLTAEVEAAKSLLASAGIRVSAQVDCGPLPVEVESVLAMVLREGLTNLLRHSSAEQCVITGSRRADTVRFSLDNDGVGRTPGPPDPQGGSGIGNLTSRVGAVDGVLTAGTRADGWYRLTVEIALARDAVPALVH